jgi:hypothetical protein
MTTHSMKVTALVAVLAIAVVMAMTGRTAPGFTEGMEGTDAAAPTPYSADHARIQGDAGAAQPPTF